MRRTVSCSLVLFLASFSSSRIIAQAGAPSLSSIETAVACAPPLTTEDAPSHSPRIIGAQDTAARVLYGPRDLLVVGAGTSSGLQLGQQFFVRRANRFGSPVDRRRQGARTLGWIRLVSVNDSTAIAAVDHGCDVISQGDYIEPFTAPVVPADVERDRPAGEPDFTAIGRVVAGLEDRQSAGPGGYVLIDRGTDQGVTLGRDAAGVGRRSRGAEHRQDAGAHKNHERARRGTERRLRRATSLNAEHAKPAEQDSLCDRCGLCVCRVNRLYGRWRGAGRWSAGRRRAGRRRG